MPPRGDCALGGPWAPPRVWGGPAARALASHPVSCVLTVFRGLGTLQKGTGVH